MVRKRTRRRFLVAHLIVRIVRGHCRWLMWDICLDIHFFNQVVVEVESPEMVRSPLLRSKG